MITDGIRHRLTEYIVHLAAQRSILLSYPGKVPTIPCSLRQVHEAYLSSSTQWLFRILNCLLSFLLFYQIFTNPGAD